MDFCRIFCLTLLFFSIPLVVVYGQVDTTYIGKFHQEFSIRTYVYQKFSVISDIIQEDKEISYRPNTPVGIGLGIQYKDFSLSGGMTFSAFRDKKRGKTKSMDFQYHYYGKKLIGDIFFQRYKGFYYSEKKKEGEIIHLHPDIRLVQYGLNGQYIFNNKKFSYRAAFNQHEKQLKSAGSFQLGGGMYYNRISGDSTLIVNDANDLSGYQINISGGYAYTWVIKRQFFASIGVTVGISVGAEHVKDFFKSVEVSPSTYPRVSLGYNGGSWSVGVNAVFNKIGVMHAKDKQLFVDTGRMNLCVIKRFDLAPKILKKIKVLNKE